MTCFLMDVSLKGGTIDCLLTNDSGLGYWRVEGFACLKRVEVEWT